MVATLSYPKRERSENTTKTKLIVPEVDYLENSDNYVFHGGTFTKSHCPFYYYLGSSYLPLTTVLLSLTDVLLSPLIGNSLRI